jgi:KDO2-lipid IV(A) lauroyltransferase
MSKPRSHVADYAVYLAVRIVVCVLQALPWRLASAAANGLAWLAYHVDKRHREVARENLRLAFPEISDPAVVDARVRAVFRHFFNLVVEIAHVPRRLHPGNWRQYVDLSDTGPLIRVLIGDRPILFVTGHFGNWELGGYVMGLLGFQTTAIARTLDNPYLDNFLRSFRERTGQRIVAKHGDLHRMETTLRNDGVLATLADQDAGQRGQFVDFFGRPASTHKAVALLALEHRVTMVVIGVTKTGDPFRYKIQVKDVILPEEYADRPDAIRAMTQRFTSGLEQVVRGAPEQYFWLHRRWKHQPKARKAKQAA